MAPTQPFEPESSWMVSDGSCFAIHLAPSDFHLFPHMKTWLATQLFDDDEELHAGFRASLKSQAVKIYYDGINKLVFRYDKCLNLYEDYVKQ
ncbi:hypothetical protein AVEN_177978-1 [Araneus ventricosus]|uniref:Uncharacterized protein n=1 Tax=Araneus ventricosus TaxID=182803 RepID=A0A4Y2EHY0_ARAVE|nr:hypothetical protein AVEN_177978-1 [Araneus ventricosus]